MENIVGGYCWVLMVENKSSIIGTDQLAIHSLTALEGLCRLSRKYLPTVIEMFERISCLFLRFSMMGVIDFSSFLCLDRKETRLIWVHSYIQWKFESGSGKLLQMSVLSE